jgi:sugar phosphate isomerase/epimerase
MMGTGMNTNSLGTLPLDRVLEIAVELALDYGEFPTGAWSPAPQDHDARHHSESMRRDPLAPGAGDRGPRIVGLIATRHALIAILMTPGRPTYVSDLCGIAGV